MMNNKKILKAMAAGTMAISPMMTSTMNIAAQETKIEKKNEYANELGDRVKDLEAAQALLDEAKAAYEEALLQYEEAQKQSGIQELNLDSYQQIITSQSNEIKSDIMTSLQPILDEMDSLEKELEEKNQEVKNQQAKADQASIDLEKVKKDLEEKKAKLEELKGKLGNDVDMSVLASTKAELEVVQANQKKAQEDVDVIEAEYKAASDSVGFAKARVDEAQSAYDTAVVNQQNAQTNCDAALEKVNYYENEEGVDLAKEELEKAQSDLDVAQAETFKAQNNYDTANNEYNSALAVQTDAQASYDEAVSVLNQANEELNGTQSKCDAAQKEYDDSKQQLDKKNSEIQSIQSEMEKVNAEVKQAQATYDKAVKEYESVFTPLELAQKALKEFENKYASEIENMAKGSLGYFESIGANLAVDTLTNPISNSGSTIDPTEYSNYTHLGQDGDATSLENLQRTISFIKECNEIRKKDGCSELSVSMYLMAVGELNANYCTTNINHSLFFNTGENASWSWQTCEADSSKSPFRGWYDDEKVYYDFLQEYKNEHIGCAEEEAIQAAKDAKIYPYASSGSYGHYLNVIKNYTITGYGIAQGGRYYEDHIQEFKYSGLKDDIVMSVEEFETSLNAYCEELNTIKTQYETLKQDVENKKDLNTKDNSGVTSALEVLNSKKSALDVLKQSLSISNNEKASLEGVVQSKQSTLESLNKEFESSKKVVSKKQEAKEEAKKALDLSENLVHDNKNKADLLSGVLENARKNEKSMDDKIAGLEDAIENWDSNKKSAHQQLEQFEQVLKASNEDVVQSNKNLSTLNTSLLKAKENFSKAEEVLDASQTVLREQNEILTNKKSRYDLIKTYEESQALISEIESLNALKNESLEVVNKDKEIIENLLSKLSVKRTDKNVYTNYLALLDTVLEKGTQADLSNIDDVDILVKFLHLAKDVDSLQNLQDQYEKYEQAQSNYDDLMNEILNENDDNKGVNTSVSTNILSTAMMMVTAGAGMVVLKKKKEQVID